MPAAPRPMLGAPAPALALDPDDADRALRALGHTVAQLDRTRRSLELFVAAITRIPAEDRPPTRLPTVQDARDLEAQGRADEAGPEPAVIRTRRAAAAEAARPVPGDPGTPAEEPGAQGRSAGGAERAAAPAALAAHLIGRPDRSAMRPAA